MANEPDVLAELARHLLAQLQYPLVDALTVAVNSGRLGDDVRAELANLRMQGRHDRYELARLSEDLDRVNRGCLICGRLNRGDALFIDELKDEEHDQDHRLFARMCDSCAHGFRRAAVADWKAEQNGNYFRHTPALLGPQLVYYSRAMAEWDERGFWSRRPSGHVGGVCLYKIGISVAPAVRVRVFHNALLAVEEGGRERESEVHAQFAHLRIDPEQLSGFPAPTEWFAESDELLAHIATLEAHAEAA